MTKEELNHLLIQKAIGEEFLNLRKSEIKRLRKEMKVIEDNIQELKEGCLNNMNILQLITEKIDQYNFDKTGN